MHSDSGRYNLWSVATGRARLLYVAVFALLLAVQATAELTQVQVGGEIRARGRWYWNAWQPGGRTVRIPNDQLIGRPIGPRGTESLFKWDSTGAVWTRYDQVVLLNVNADFTEDVSAFIELYHWHVWGEDFRANYLTGASLRNDNVAPIELQQTYIETRKLLDQPLRLRIGRQELVFGKGWLMNNTWVPTQFISHDAIRLTYDADAFVIDAFASKLAENTFVNDSDINMYGVHGAYSGFTPLNISLYYFLVHDRTDIPRAESSRLGRWLNTRLGYDYASTRLHTIGTRLFGKYEGFDYDLELAYQFGDASHLGALFKVVGSNFGDTNAKYDNFGVDAVIGYTFQDISWTPRIYVQGVFLEGQDNRDITFWEWLNPFYRPKASVSFNRLFSGNNYMPVVNDNTWLSNFYQANIGLELQPTPKVRLHAHVARNWIHKPFNRPKSIKFGGRRIPIARNLSFWTDDGSNDIGWEVVVWLRYHYSEDLTFTLYGSHLWPKAGLTDGAFMHFNGTEFSGGSGKSNAGYVTWLATLKF